MGKSNRIRNDRANATLASVTPSKKKKGMPSWALNLITIAVAAVILLTVAFSLLTANGVFGRMQTAMKTENFRVSRNMMQYFLSEQYSSNYSSYLSQSGISLSDTVSTEDTDTWLDLIVSSTESYVQQMLMYCEEAEARNIELTKEEKDSIKEQIDYIETMALTYGFPSANSFISANYGDGVSKGDVRKCMEITALYNKCRSEISVELEDGITDDDVTSEYNDNKLDYDILDLLRYDIEIKYADIKEEAGEDATEEDIVNAYKAAIDAAKAKVETILAATSESEFKNAVTDYLVEKLYEETYEEERDADTDVTDEVIPETEETIGKALVAHIAELIKNEEDFNIDDVVTEDGKVLGNEVQEAYSTFIKAYAQELYDDAHAEAHDIESDNNNYSDADDVLVWAFEEDCKAGDTKSFENGDSADGAALAEDTSELSSFKVEMVYLVTEKHANETLSKDVAFIIFSTEETATEALAKLADGMSKEDLETIANDLAGSMYDYENYTEGTLTADGLTGTEFEAWLYADDTVVGSYTASVISMGDSLYAVALYYDDGMEQWKVSVKDAIFSERSTAKAEEIELAHIEKFKVYATETVNDQEQKIYANPRASKKLKINA